MAVYSAPLLFLVWALIAQIRGNKHADLRALAVCKLPWCSLRVEMEFGCDYEGKYSDLTMAPQCSTN